MKKYVLFLAVSITMILTAKSQIDSTIFSQRSFFSTETDSVNSYPHTLGSGDIDGDGKIDIVVPNSRTNTISIFRNICASGHTFDSTSFATRIDITVLNSPLMATVTDIDNDGKQDIAVSHYNSNFISIFPGSSSIGTISFGTRIDIPASTNPSYVIFSDLDGDGKPDMIVSNFGAATISFYKNISTTGNISFDANIDYSTGDGPALIKAVDLNKDGKKDIIVTNYNSNSFSVFKNKSTVGNISFDTAKNFTSDGGPNGFDVYDVNNDSLPDLAIANSNWGQVSFFQNISTNDTINFIEKIVLMTGDITQQLIFSDLDNDGIKDLCVTNRGSNTMTILHYKIGMADSTIYDKITNFDILGGPLSIVAADMDNNGSMDLVLTNYYSGGITVLTNKMHSSSTGVNETFFRNENAITIYPNPFNNILNIPIINNESLEVVMLYDIIGNLLFSTKDQIINTNNLSNGTYFIEVKTDKGLHHTKVVKQN